jgi:hypothetical protein
MALSGMFQQLNQSVQPNMQIANGLLDEASAGLGGALGQAIGLSTYRRLDFSMGDILLPPCAASTSDIQSSESKY